MVNCGCPPNDSTLIQGPQGEPGKNGVDAVCTNGTNAKTRIDTSFGSGVFTESNVPVTIAEIISPGTINMPQLPTKIYAIVSTTSITQVSIVSSLGVVAGSAIVYGGAKQLIDLGTVDTSKLSAGAEMLQLQAYCVGGRVEVFALSILSI